MFNCYYYKQSIQDPRYTVLKLHNIKQELLQPKRDTEHIVILASKFRSKNKRNFAASCIK